MSPLQGYNTVVNEASNSTSVLYKDSDHDDKKKWKGLFRNPFVVRTFAAHLGAIEGSVKVPGLHDLDKRTPAMVGGLGLAAASVERALTLVANEILTIQVARASKGKPISIPRTANLSSGKESMRQTGFSEVAWGKATRGYAKSAASLTKLKFDFIVQDAEESMKPIRARNKTTATISIDDDDDERAHLVDNSDESDVEYDLLPESMEWEAFVLLYTMPISFSVAYYDARFNSGSFHSGIFNPFRMLSTSFGLT
ncbi:hypothetical protein JOM56_007682 [Amanita muscaria]